MLFFAQFFLFPFMESQKSFDFWAFRYFSRLITFATTQRLKMMWRQTESMMTIEFSSSKKIIFEFSRKRGKFSIGNDGMNFNHVLLWVSKQVTKWNFAHINGKWESEKIVTWGRIFSSCEKQCQSGVKFLPRVTLNYIKLEVLLNEFFRVKVL